MIATPAAFDLAVASPFNPTTLPEVGVTSLSAAMAAEVQKHGADCSELGWVCISLAVETYWASAPQQ